MYLYIELWKAKEAWLKLTPEARKAKIDDLLAEAKAHPITGVIPFSFKKIGDVYLLDGVTEQPILIDPSVARPPAFRYAAAWMIPTRDLIAKFEERVENLGWWWEYFEQENAWGEMDVMATVGDMINYSGQGAQTDPFEGSKAGEERGRYCWCPPGKFKMGFAGTDVTLSRGFWMGKFPVTQEEFEKVMGYNPSGFEGPSLPVESVDRRQILKFCQELTRIERAAGKLPENWEYRLATEAQWEYASRAGTTTAYSWGDDEKLADDYAWHIGNSGFMTHPVGQKKPNPWGLCDTIGNVLEWCRDAWLEQCPGGVDPEVTEAEVPSRPGQSEAPFWVCRGGGWFIPAAVTPRVRVRLGSGDQGYLLGFRVVIERSDGKLKKEPLQEWGEVMKGRWVSENNGGPASGRQQSAVEGESFSHWILDGAALEGEFRIGKEGGKWLTGWDGAARQITQYTVNSNGSTVLTYIAKEGDQWVWRESANYPDGQKETGKNVISIREGGNVLTHHHTNRVRGGQVQPDIHSSWRRISP